MSRSHPESEEDNMIYLTENGAYAEADFLAMEAVKCEAHVGAWRHARREARRIEQERKNQEFWSEFF